MRSNDGRRRLCGVLAAGSALTLMNVHTRAADDAEPWLEEVVITATKRTESLQSVPMSVQALTESALTERRITDLSALAGSIPGLSLQDGGPGYRALYVRGVSSAAGNASTTGVYLDEVFVPPGGIGQAMIEPMYFDIDRIEVLRGPQGTIFGGSSMGGTIRFLTRQPDPTAHAMSLGSELSFTQDGGTNYQINGMANVPLAADTAAVRIVTSYRDRDGFVDKLIGNFSDPARLGTGPITRVRDVNDEEYSSARIQGFFAPVDGLEIRPAFLYQKTQTASVGAIDRPPGKLDQRRGVRVDEPVEDEFRLGNLVLNYQWDAVQLLSSSAYSERDSSFKEDASDILEETVIPLSLRGPRGVFIATTFDGAREERSFQQEVRVSSTDERRIDWLAGLYYERYERTNWLDWRVNGFSAMFFPVPGDNFYHGVSTLERTQKAAFAEANWHVTQKLTATLGLRWYDFDTDTQSLDRDGLINGGPLPDAPVISSQENGVSPRFSLAYDFGDQLVYATASKGFRPGGPNSDIPGVAIGSTCVSEYRAAGFEVSDNGELPAFESDELWNYEVGAKTVWGGGRFVVNGAAYRMNWNDLQQGFVAPCGFGATLNFGKARISGLEVDYRLLLTSAFELSGGLNYNKGETTEDLPQLGVPKGTQIQNAPEWSGNVGARYGFPLWGGEAYVGSTLRYVDKSYRSFDRSDPSNIQESYTLVGARIGLARDSWSVSLFGDNLTKETPNVMHFVSTYLGTPSHKRMFTLRGRTVGVEFRKDF